MNRPWPFQSPLALPPDEADRWWEHCFLPFPWPELRTSWVAVVGPTGSGKSVALAYRQREEKETFFLLYSLAHWPNGAKAWVSLPLHLPQILAAGGWVLQHYLRSHPEQIQRLDALHREYLRWLLEKHHGERMYRRFAMTFSNEGLMQVPYSDLYPTYTAQSDIAGQIDEFVTLVQALGFRKVRLVCDFNEHDLMSLEEEDLDQFVNEIILGVEHPDFGGYLGLPTGIAQKVLSQARGRVQRLPLQWTPERVTEAVKQAWAAAGCEPAEGVWSLSLWKQFEQHLRQRGVKDPWVPRYWVNFAEAVCALAQNTTTPAVTQISFDAALAAFYERHVPLRVDRRREQVWLGDWPLRLTPQVHTLLMVLVENRGHPVDPLNEHLLARLDLRGGTEESARQTVHTLISRLRKALEPVPSRSIYLHNRRWVGYWIEHVQEVETS